MAAEPSPNHQRSHPLLDELRGIGLAASDYVVFGSGPLLIRGWIAEVGDLDILARGQAWARARELGRVEYLEEWDVTVVNIGPSITVGTRWAIGDVDVDALIDGADIIDGLPFATLEAVITYKRLSDRPKDREHLAIVERFTSPRCVVAPRRPTRPLSMVVRVDEQPKTEVSVAADALVIALARGATEAAIDPGAEAEVRRLATSIDWERSGPNPARPGEECVVRLDSGKADGPAVYLVSDGVGVVSRPHEHQTWAVIVGIAGHETNHHFLRAPGSKRVATRTETTILGPGDALTLGSDAIHATEVDGNRPTYHLHVYGRPLDELPPFRDRSFTEQL